MPDFRKSVLEKPEAAEERKSKADLKHAAAEKTTVPSNHTHDTPSGENEGFKNVQPAGGSLRNSNCAPKVANQRVCGE